MIIVVVEVKVDSGAAAKVKEAITKMETATRQEAGCITYAFSVDVSDDTTIRVIERWKSMDDIRSHMASPHMAEFNAAMGAIRPKGLDIKAYEATEVALG
jgi:quinol monooxygenase YgiN